MRNAYALLGLSFIVVFGGAYLIYERAHAPSPADNPSDPMALTLSSPAFENNGTIPSTYTCDGSNTMPPLDISGVPEGTKSLVIVMDDPDIPQQVKDANQIEKFDHFVIYAIPPETTHLTADAIGGNFGINGAGDAAYAGPCPPPQYEPKEHRYVFRLYALSGILNFIKAPTLDEVETAAKSQMIESAELIGRYERK
jgi:Raf kinase inhibitor-like YbhB/YbcL family protein